MRSTPAGLALVLLMAWLFSACQQPPALPGSYEILTVESEGAEVVSRRIALVADNQLSSLAGDPVPLLRTELSDQLVWPAIRAVQLDLFGQDFLRYVLEDTLTPVVHLGDACNMANTGEFDRFVEIMGLARKGWIMTPGNHDGFFFGNEHRDASSEDWRAACARLGEPLTKDRFVRRYLWAVSGQGGAEFAELRRALGADASAVATAGTWRYPDDRPGFLRAVAWRIDVEAPWRSYVLQEFDMSRPDDRLPGAARGMRFRGLLLDTVQYARRPTLLPTGLTVNAGVSGQVLEDQMGVARRWLRRGTDGTRWVLAGHHPMDDLTGGTGPAMQALRGEADVMLYLSAHTHDGEFRVNAPAAGGDVWLEINVGSILDWPVEYRTLSFFRRPDGRIMLRSPRYELPEMLLVDLDLPQAREGWEAQPGDPDEFLAHTKGRTLDPLATEVGIKRSVLASYDRLLANVPTARDFEPGDGFWPEGCSSDGEVRTRLRALVQSEDESREEHDRMADLVVELERFEKERPVTLESWPEARQEEAEERHRAYRLSQAIWAAKYDAEGSRKPVADDWFVVLPGN